jgi:hypothetical protein
MQEASRPSTPTEGEGLEHSALGIGRLCPVKKVLSGCAREKLRKAWASKTGTGRQSAANKCKYALGETTTDTPEGSAPIETIRPSKRHRDSTGPGTYKDALNNIRKAIFRETYPEDNRRQPELYSARTGKGIW